MFVRSTKESKYRIETPGTTNRSIFLRSFFSATGSKVCCAASVLDELGDQG